MLLSVFFVMSGLFLLFRSAEYFVGSSASLARYLGMSPLLIGMIIIGFGTSLPEMLVSVQSVLGGNTGIALGNAYGSNIANIGLIIGLTAVISPITVHSGILKRELPFLAIITFLTVYFIRDLIVNRSEALILLVIFFITLGWTIIQGKKKSSDSLYADMEQEFPIVTQNIRQTILQIFLSLLVLILSSRMLVRGAVEIAQKLGVSDLFIGLTIVAVGTSLPEMASSIMAVRKGEHDLALGNILGSNLFNTLAVVGLAGIIHPMYADRNVLYRDMPVMGLLTLMLFIMSYGFGKPGRINRFEGIILITSYLAYILYLFHTL